MTAGTLTEVVIEPRSPDPLIRALNYAPNGNGDLAAQIGARLAGRTIWNVNSTATGGGVAEMLPSLIGYARGMGVDTRWLVIGGTPDFFALTKRLHHALHGSRGDASALASSQRAVYEEVLRPSAEAMVRTVRPGDAVVLHDPQTAGLAPQLVKVGARVIWRCHIGYERWNEHTQAGWDFLAPYLDCVPAYVFSRRAYAPVHFDARRCHVIAPSIDPAAAKNEDLADAVVRSVLVQTGLLAGTPGGSEFVFSGANGGERRVHRAVRFMTGRTATCPGRPAGTAGVPVGSVEGSVRRDARIRATRRRWGRSARRTADARRSLRRGRRGRPGGGRCTGGDGGGMACAAAAGAAVDPPRLAANRRQGGELVDRQRVAAARDRGGAEEPAGRASV